MASSHHDPYVQTVLELYRATPGTRCRVRPADRRLAQELYERRIPIQTIRAAFLLAVSRRALRPLGAQPLAKIASLHYFRPVIQELIDSPPETEYIDYLADRLASLAPQLTAICMHQLPRTEAHQLP